MPASFATAAGLDDVNVFTQANTFSSTLAVTGALTGSSLALSAGLTVATTAAITGNTTVGGTLGVTGNVTLTAGLTVGTTLGVTGNATVGGTLGVTGNTTLGGTCAVTGDISAAGGFKREAPFLAEDVAAGDNATPASSTPVAIALGGVTGLTWQAMRAGSVTGFSVLLNTNAAGSDLLARVRINGTPVAASLVTIASGAAKGRITFAKDTATLILAAGDEVDVDIRTGSAWSATSADIACMVELEC